MSNTEVEELLFSINAADSQGNRSLLDYGYRQLTKITNSEVFKPQMRIAKVLEERGGFETTVLFGYNNLLKKSRHTREGERMESEIVAKIFDVITKSGDEIPATKVFDALQQVVQGAEDRFFSSDAERARKLIIDVVPRLPEGQKAKALLCARTDLVSKEHRLRVNNLLLEREDVGVEIHMAVAKELMETGDGPTRIRALRKYGADLKEAFGERYIECVESAVAFLSTIKDENRSKFKVNKADFNEMKHIAQRSLTWVTQAMEAEINASDQRAMRAPRCETSFKL